VRSEDFPKISIVTPSLNQSRFLEAAINSVVSQKYPDFQYFVMDGGSSDGSVEIIRKYSDRIDFWRSGDDRGQADAIYQGFERSSGDILGWLNSDDLLLPGCLEKVGSYFAKHPEIDCVVGGSILIDESGTSLGIVDGKPAFNLGTVQNFRKLLLWECGGFYQPASFWRRNAFFDEGGFDRELSFCFDYDMYLRLARRGPFGLIEDFLASFRVHSTSKTNTMSDVWRTERDAVLKQHGRNKVPALARYIIRRCYVLADSIRKKRLKSGLKSGRIVLPGASLN